MEEVQNASVHITSFRRTIKISILRFNKKKGGQEVCSFIEGRHFRESATKMIVVGPRPRPLLIQHDWGDHMRTA